MGGPSAEARAALRASGDRVREMLDEAGSQFRRGEPGIGWERLEELRIAREAYAAAEAGMSAEARAWQELLDQRVQEWGVQTKQAARALQELNAVPGTKQVAPPQLAEAPVYFRQQSSRLTDDLDRLVIRGEYEAALAGYHQRLGLLRQLGAGDTPQVKMLAEKTRRVRTIVETRRRFAQAAAGPDDGHNAKISTDDVKAIDAEAGVQKVRMALPGEQGTYSDPYWVWRKTEKGLQKDGVFKGSGEGFADHYDLRAERVYADVGDIVGVDVPACAQGKMTIGGQAREGIYVRNANGTCLKHMSREAQIALKPQIARDRVLAAFLGDHDRHMGNYLVTSDGKVISIDHGMADVCGKRLGENSPLATDETFRTAMKSRIVDMGRGRYGLTYIDEHMTIEDMASTIEQIENLCRAPDRLRDVLGKTLSGMELEDAVQVLTGRARVLRQVIKECFGSAADSKAIPVTASAEAWPWQDEPDGALWALRAA